MSAIRTNAAANLLGVSASTLRSWERRYQFPHPGRSVGGHRQYELGQVEALRQALGHTGNISSAVEVARERGAAPSGCAHLVAALTAFDDAAVSRVLEESLALRSVERTLEDLLLPAVESVAHDPGLSTPEYEFALGHATVWISALKRIGAPAVRPEGVLIFDAAPAGSVDGLHAFALELLVRRGGLRTLTLTPAVDPTRLSRAISVLRPGAVVLTGAGASLDAVGRLVFAVRSQSDGATVFDYRGAIPHTGGSTVTRLGERPVAAAQGLLAALAAPAALAGGHTLAGHAAASPYG